MEFIQTPRSTDATWLSDHDWRIAQRSLPIACVDVLPIRKSESNKAQIGLISRNTPHQGRCWCLIGGRLLLNEPLRSAIARQIEAALGPAVECVMREPVQPIFVAEYFSEQRKDELFDPRQHAIGMTFAARVEGETAVTGEALAFRWFDIGNPPRESEIGFGQAKVLAACLRNIDFNKMA